MFERGQKEHFEFRYQGVTNWGFLCVFWADSRRLSHSTLAFLVLVLSKQTHHGWHSDCKFVTTEYVLRTPRNQPVCEYSCIQQILAHSIEGWAPGALIELPNAQWDLQADSWSTVGVIFQRVIGGSSMETVSLNATTDSGFRRYDVS